MLMNKSNVNKIYYFFDGDKPTASLGKLCDIILNNYLEIPNKEEIYNITVTNKLWSTSKKETVIKKFDKSEFWNYLEAQFEGKNKVLVTTEEKVMSSQIVDVLLTHEYSKDIFSNPDSIYQLKFNYKDSIGNQKFNFRGIIDIVLIDDKNKTVTLIDLKTGSNSALDFKNSFIK